MTSSHDGAIYSGLRGTLTVTGSPLFITANNCVGSVPPSPTAPDNHPGH
jgi:hypothetical protein